MSLHIAKLFSRPLALASAALVIHIGAATAADSSGDIQQQMRDVLAGTVTAHSASQPGLREDKVRTRTVATGDVQQQMRGLLAGTITTHPASQSGPRDDKATIRTADSTGDVQQQMKDLLAGTITTHSAPQSGPREDARRATASRVYTNQASK